MAAPLMTLDSGVGGLSVFRHIVKALPNHDHVYVADDLGFPYGDWEEAALSDHLFETISKLIATHRPALVTIACNTASTLILDRLRAAFDIPFVGTVPAIKPAADITKTGLVSILATPATVKRDYTKALIEQFAPKCDVTLVGAGGLAKFAEEYVRYGFVEEDWVMEEARACFQEADDGRRTDVVVLACTHYPFLKPVLQRHMPWPVTFIDPAAAIARRVVTLAPGETVPAPQTRYESTSGTKLALDEAFMALPVG